jgi:hypothetical protein
MKTVFFIILAFWGLAQTQNCDKKTAQSPVNMTTPTPKATTRYDRLPENITLESKVAKETKNDRGEFTSVEIVTVEKRLNELKARYEKDRLVDEKGKEIRFFQTLCRGVSAGEEQDEIDRKAKEKELAELEQKYTVIILQCDPSKVM